MNRRLLYLLLTCIWVNLSAQPGQLHTIQIGKGELPAFFNYSSDDRYPLVSAHRGGRYLPGYPENALATFEYVLERTPAIIEFDVNMTRDSVLILMHDASLDRTTTGTGKVADRTWEEIRALFLVDDFGERTPYRVPLFSEVLEWLTGKTIVTVDVKRGVPYPMVVEMIEAAEAEDYAVVITYNVPDAQLVHRLNPDLMISLSIRNAEELERAQAAGLPFDRLLAFTGTREPDPALYEALHQRQVPCILGTMGNLDRMAQARGADVYRELIRRGADILSTDFPVTTAEAIAPLAPQEGAKAEKVN